MNSYQRAKEIRYPKWVYEPKVGMVLRMQSGVLRVIRKVTGHRERRILSFTIQHCSWTHRCHTCYTAKECWRYGWRFTGKSVSLDKPIDQTILQEISHVTDRLLTCCDVEGIG